MEERQALSAFAALSQETRLRIVRLLVTAGPDGMAAGAIADAAGVSASNVSFHLKELTQAGLATAKREARSIYYAADYAALSGLIAFLMRDCCAGHPEICIPAAAQSRCAPRRRSCPVPDRIYNVLFLCTGNSARSILAESILQKDGAGRFRAFSAGSQPKGEVNPLALQTLRSWDYSSEGFSSKSWDVFAAPDAPVMDFVFTVCDSAAGEACPVWPGQPMTAHWGIEDPAAVEGTAIERLRAFNTAMRYMKTRISLFTSLPIASLDAMALGAKLREIGHAEGSTAQRGDAA